MLAIALPTVDGRDLVADIVTALVLAGAANGVGREMPSAPMPGDQAPAEVRGLLVLVLEVGDVIESDVARRRGRW
ncbi:MAG: hypothetical protein U5Q44_04485 [Dehalococcoidia bacterium]|nr:hypothetical protein [Dehalococcoidia bacterium]